MRPEVVIVLFATLLGCVLTLSPLVLFGDGDQTEVVTKEDLSSQQIESLESGPFAFTLKDRMNIKITSAILYNNSLIISGEFENTVTIGGAELQSRGSTDIIIASLDVNGTWSWVQVIGGNGSDRNSILEIDEQYLFVKGSIYGEIEVNAELIGDAKKTGHQRIIAEISFEQGGFENIVLDPFGDLSENPALWCGWR